MPSQNDGLMGCFVPLWALWEGVIQAAGLETLAPLRMSLIFWGMLASALMEQPLQVLSS